MSPATAGRHSFRSTSLTTLSDGSYPASAILVGGDEGAVSYRRGSGAPATPDDTIVRLPRGSLWHYSPPSASAQAAQAAAGKKPPFTNAFSAEQDFFLAQLSRHKGHHDAVPHFREQFGETAPRADGWGHIKDTGIKVRTTKFYKMTDDEVAEELERLWGWPRGSMERKQPAWKASRAEKRRRFSEQKKRRVRGRTEELEREQQAMINESRARVGARDINAAEQERMATDTKEMAARVCKRRTGGV